MLKDDGSLKQEEDKIMIVVSRDAYRFTLDGITKELRRGNENRRHNEQGDRPLVV